LPYKMATSTFVSINEHATEMAFKIRRGGKWSDPSDHVWDDKGGGIGPFLMCIEVQPVDNRGLYRTNIEPGRG